MTAATVRPSDPIDLSSLDFWALPQAQRNQAFAWLRDNDPLSFYEEPEPAADFIPKGEGYYAVTKWADIDRVSREPGVFSSAAGSTSIQDLPPEFLVFFGSMINLDAPEHLTLRRIVASSFTPRMLRQLDVQIEQTATEIINDVAPRGEVDFVTDVAAALPLKIICKMMGVPDSEYDRVFRCTNIILGAADPEYVADPTEIATALLTAGGELSGLLAELAQARKTDPTDDLTSALVHAELDGKTLTEAEIGSFFILLAVAGNETTRNAISHALVLLTENPDQREIWQGDLAGVSATAVDEVVRWASPVAWMRRTVTADTELRGKQLHAGDKLLMFYGSGNRDSEVFTDPDAFDVRRSPNPHVGFGSAGPHYCLGAHLARREITEMYRQLLTRLPDIQASGAPEQLLSSFINGIKHLPATFTPVRPGR